ncbi:protein of unknown function [Candidatus Nitrospira inopinata]|jgi:hypothetical protein|uniref:Uncharacterized protein n=1 Tax=Candidatus Nitrospira inopinata TaxID=1715989 RepID=A0A0S4KUB1_9BACT|nr:protein of unknown function [Candidatus Nitrospira inopinata]
MGDPSTYAADYNDALRNKSTERGVIPDETILAPSVQGGYSAPLH